MTNLVGAPLREFPVIALARRILCRLDQIPYGALALPLRFAVATIFWFSAMTKLPSWETTVALFRDEYQVPVLPPELAAYIVTSIELSTPVLLVSGLLVRPAAAILLGMTIFIEIFVYPDAWPTHLQWAAMLLVLIARGGGRLSLDWLIRRRFLGER
jgi:putative oxidoreductase